MRRQKPKGSPGSLGRSRSPMQRFARSCGGTGAPDGIPADGAAGARAGAGADGGLDALRRGTSDDGGYGYGYVAAADAAADAQRRLSA